MLITDVRLSILRVACDHAAGRLTIDQGDERVLDADLHTSVGRAAVEQFSIGRAG